LGRTLLIVYLLETGLVLLVAPWSVFWERNLMVELFPRVGEIILWPSVRGGVSGLGVVNVAAGMVELGGVFRSWMSRRSASACANRAGVRSALSSREGESL